MKVLNKLCLYKMHLHDICFGHSFDSKMQCETKEVSETIFHYVSSFANLLYLIIQLRFRTKLSSKYLNTN